MIGSAPTGSGWARRACSTISSSNGRNWQAATTPVPTTSRSTEGAQMTSKLFPYSPAPESRAIVNIASSYGLFVGGEFVEPEDGETFKTVNPASEEVLAEISEAGPR